MAIEGFEIEIGIDQVEIRAFVDQFLDAMTMLDGINTHDQMADVAGLLLALDDMLNQVVATDFLCIETRTGTDANRMFATASPFGNALLQLLICVPAVISARRAAAKASAP